MRNDLAVPEPTTRETNDAVLVLTVPILEQMRAVEGWLSDGEGDLLIASCARALSQCPAPHAVVEIGSYYGRSTVVLGSVVKLLGRPDSSRLYAIDPHLGHVAVPDKGIQIGEPTFEKFRRNIAEAGLDHFVEPIQKCSFEVEWCRPICFLFIDGLHDYANVARDFDHFERWLMPGGYVAFHDYADYFPGVKMFVNEVLAAGQYERAASVLNLILLRKLKGAAG